MNWDQAIHSVLYEAHPGPLVSESKLKRMRSSGRVRVVGCVLTFLLGAFVQEVDAQTIELIARSGDPAPDGNGVFQGFGQMILINDAGIVAFEGGFRDAVTSNTNLDGAKLRTDGADGLIQIARHDDPRTRRWSIPQRAGVSGAQRIRADRFQRFDQQQCPGGHVHW